MIRYNDSGEKFKVENLRILCYNILIFEMKVRI